jgi:hypothetical protein
MKKVFLVLILILFFWGVSNGQAEELRRDSVEMHSLAFSPDGTTLAFIKNDQNHSVHILSLPGKGLRTLLTEPGEKRSLSFSGDGKTLFFCWKKAGNFDIAALNVSAGKVKMLTSTPEDEFQVSCSQNTFFRFDEKTNAPGQEFFKLHLLHGSNGHGGLEIMDADGKNRANLLPGEFTRFSLGGQWSQLLISDKSGIQIIPYVGLMSFSLPGSSPVLSTFDLDLKPNTKVTATGSADLSDHRFSADFINLLARDQSGRWLLLNTRTGERRTVPGEFTGDAVAHPHGRGLAFVGKSGDEFVLSMTPWTERDLTIVNTYLFPESPFSSGGPTSEARKKLSDQSFVVVPGANKEFYHLYETARYNLCDTFITADSAYYLFHLFYDFSLKEIEKSTFRQRVFAAVNAMASEAIAASGQAKEPRAREAFSRLAGLFTLASLLEEADETKAAAKLPGIPETLRSAVSEDFRRIFAAQGDSSAVLAKRLDFTQFKLRGHYEKEAALRSYFRAVMLLGQAPFRVFDAIKEDQPSADIPSILALFYLAGKAKIGRQSVLDVLSTVSDPLNFLIGDNEDIGALELDALFTGAVMLKTPDDVTDPAMLQQAFAKLRECKKPRVSPHTNVQVLFFPQRYTLDADIFARLTYKRVGTDAQPRWLPSMLDVPAALGSERATKILFDTLKQDQFQNYPQQLQDAKTMVKALSEGFWQKNIYQGWLKTFADLIALEGKTREAFTRSEAWHDRMLNTILGSLTTLKHDTILYAKMNAAEAGGGPEEEMILAPPRVYLDPYPELFGDLKRLSLEFYARMAAQGLFPTKDRVDGSEEGYDSILGLSGKGLALRIIRLYDLLETAARKQAAGTPLTREEHVELLLYGARLEHLTIALRRESETEYANLCNDEVALVADVATGNQTCLTAAIGRVFNLFVLQDFPTGTRMLQGGVFSFFEFEQPIGARLSDHEWRKMIRDNKLPPLPTWTSSFISGALPVITPSEWEQETDSDNP